MALWKLLSNWKMVIAYLLMNIPGLGAYPMLVEALHRVMEAPAPQAILNLAVQILLATGVLHRVLKNINGASK